MDTDKSTTSAGDGPEEGATPEAVALHGDRARAETHPQPDVVTLPGDTHIATEPAESETVALPDERRRSGGRNVS